ncbi:acetyl-CoA synthetase [Sulfodiicoccus acidiphilus]|uniref:Acetyl-CoA synthetase n=1 Tax=Sulfodiicoccus acidiphilus TaxID=1670455 RepID=A0A348B1R9_9CREN|nr:acetyl-CoA synthetase [Sulfodiicoccus acidiphilus]GGT94829.1 acetyl-CoA synthetase [Sulfodiicoccus acidiphilus]
MKFNPTFILDQSVQSHREKIALVFDEKSFTYEEVLKEVSRAANVVSKLGVEKRNIVMILSFDSMQALSVWLGTLRAGAIPAWVSPLYNKETISYFLELLEPKVIFSDVSLLDRLGLNGQRVVTLGGRVEGLQDYASLSAEVPDQFEPIKVHRDDPTYLLFSGGTTGRPKAVVHTARDFVHVPHRHSKFMGWRESDVHYATSQKYFTHGMWPGVLIPIANGASAILTTKKLTPQVVADILRNHKPTVFITVPTVLKWLVNLEERPDLSSVRMVVSASEKLPIPLLEKFRELYGIEVLDSIGSSEVTYEWISNRPGDNKPGTCGRPIFGVEVKLVDLVTGTEIREPNKLGEVWVKSDTNAYYYLRDLEKTRRTMVGEWIRTGDVMYFDDDGYYVHVGRNDDLFKVKGMWVSPLEIEEVLLRHPAVLEAAVVQAKDADGLTVPAAFLALRPGYTMNAELESELREMVRRELGEYKVPKLFRQVEEIPRTPLMKLDRRRLREQLGERL